MQPTRPRRINPEHQPLHLAEVFGLRPIGVRLAEAKRAAFGDGDTPPSRWSLSTLKILQPRRALLTWLGRTRADGRIPIYNLFNHRMTDPARGWSVRKTQVLDFRGGTLTYDSHNGTDFIVPPGTLVVAPAPARVLRISSEFHRGGLKIFLDHGKGLATSLNHLARPLVRVGDTVARGAPIALSGYSGIDAVITFPWGAPHVHMNVWLNGEYVDPFARAGEVSIFRGGIDVRAAAPVSESAAEAEPLSPTQFAVADIAAQIASCKDPVLRAAMTRIRADDERAMAVLMHRNYFPTKFGPAPSLYGHTFARAPWLDLPFCAEQWSGVDFAD